MFRIQICAMALALTGAAPPAPLPQWDIRLTEPLAPGDVAGLDYLELDPDATSRDQITAIAARGITPICYVSVGTAEDYRRDLDMFPASIRGKRYADWPDEVFVDIRQHDIVLPIMQARFRRCADLGFRAVDPDNIDVYDNDSGFPLTADDSIAYLRALAGIAHGMGLAIGQKNAPDLTPALVADLDFAVTEGCFTDGWCARMAAYPRSGKPVFAIEYRVPPDQQKTACTTARQQGLSMIFKNRDLTAGGQSCQP